MHLRIGSCHTNDVKGKVYVYISRPLFVTVRIVGGAGSMQLSGVHLSVCLSIRGVVLKKKWEGRLKQDLDKNYLALRFSK